jgi:RHS repeat-associated protein
MSGNNGLFFYYVDHLGSTSIMLRSNGDFVSGSTARYHPFGGWRTTPNQTITDRGFTGHAHNNLGANDLGLVYMGARFYLPGVGRFLSADVLVPDPTNPQQFNRYSYVLNNALRYTDPSGRYCYDPSAGPDLVGTCVNEDGSTYSLLTPPPPTLAEQAQQGSNIYGIIFMADAGKTWSQAQMVAVLQAAQDIEARFRSTGLFNGYTAGQIWREIFGPITMHRSAKTHWTDRAGNQHAIDYGAQVFGSRIEVYDAASNIPFNFRLNMVHEFGHRFNAVTVIATNMDPYNELGVAISDRVLPLRNDIRAGMPGGPYQQSPFNTTNNELFADMFLNWTYRSFVNNPEGGRQSNWMNSRMPVWLGR